MPNSHDQIYLILFCIIYIIYDYIILYYFVIFYLFIIFLFDILGGCILCVAVFCVGKVICSVTLLGICLSLDARVMGVWVSFWDSCRFWGLLLPVPFFLVGFSRTLCI